MPYNPIIAAIDTPEHDAARQLITSLAPEVGMIKLGLEFFVRHGMQGLHRLELEQQGIGLFLDLKFHDIPNTVRGAVTSAMASRCRMLTIHASGGASMCRAAQDAVQNAAAKQGVAVPLLLAVTVLTSLSAAETAAIGFSDPESQVLRLAEIAISAGVTGLVCSPHEIAAIRQRFGQDVTLVVPGIRASNAASDDQTRTMSASEALKAGANYLVIGRPITQADNPADAARAIRLSF